MVLLTLKSAVNFIVYCWFSEKFRSTLKKIFCSRCLGDGGAAVERTDTAAVDLYMTTSGRRKVNGVGGGGWESVRPSSSGVELGLLVQ